MKVKIFGKVCDYIPSTDDLNRERLKLKLIEEPSFRRVFKNNLTDKFFDSMKKMVDPNHLHEDNTILSLSGFTGTGKSIVSLSIAKNIVPERFTYKNMCFFDNEIKKLVKILPRDSFVVRDEGTNKAVFGIGSVQESSEFELIVESSRKKGLSIILVEPSEKKKDIIKWYLETVDKDVKNRVTRVAIKEPSTMKYLGAIYVPVVNDFDYDWIKYNENKDKFIDDLQQGKMSNVKMNPKDVAKELYEELDIDVYKKPKERKAWIVSKYPQYTGGQVDLIYTWLEMLIRQDGVLDD